MLPGVRPPVLMKAKFLVVTIYEPDGLHPRTETVPLSRAADLEQITTAIHRLDRCHYPFILIRQTEDEESDYMNVMGGEGVYMIEVQASQFDRFFNYIDVSKGRQRVEVWRSDQGASVPEYHVCRDLALVIAVAHEYALAGTLSDRVDWLLRR